MAEGDSYNRNHQSHDSRALLARWRKVARLAGLQGRVLLQTPGGFSVPAYFSRNRTSPALYLSAGVHGDEPAPVSALLEWAEANLARLKSACVVILPLVNPDGLAANTRVDGAGIDLNRHFHDATHPLIRAWQNLVAGRRFELGLMLHEDYDARGAYCYELSEHGGLADALLPPVDPVLPRDPRGRIDGRTAKNGIIQRKNPPLDLPGLPEAIALYRTGAAATLTFETPSEFALHQRVQAHRTFLDAAADSLGI
ncbi:MAG: M14 family metallocarboxypeptidase [Verrucomicrobiales bacterium]|nr:M14 family metallocarboxypeptidase [Verrucomicrobiales bacterium]